MATLSYILAWEIPWTEEPGRLYIVHRVAKVSDTTVEGLARWLKPQSIWSLENDDNEQTKWLPLLIKTLNKIYKIRYSKIILK